MNIQNMHHQAKQLHQKGHILEAIKLYQQILNHHPEDSETLHLYGLALGQSGQYLKGIECIQQAIQKDNTNPLFYNNLGNLYYANSNWIESIKAYQKSLNYRPDHIYTLYNLAGAFKQSEQLEQAITIYKQTLSIQPRFAEVHNNLGEIYIELKEYSLAFEQLKKAREINPQLAEVHNNLGNWYKFNDHIELALSSYKEALNIQPEMLEVHKNLGQIYYDNQQYSLALTHFQKALILAPDAELYVQKGLTYQKMKQNRLALESYETALNLNPDHTTALINSGAILAQPETLNRAKELYKQAIESDPQALKAYYSLGNALLIEDEVEQARNVFEKAQSIKNYDAITFKLVTSLPGIISFEENIPDLRKQFRARLEALFKSDIHLKEPSRELDQVSFYLAYHGYDDLPLMKSMAKLFLKACPDLEWTAPHCLKPIPKRNKIKIGFISQYFHNHSIGKFMRGIIGHLNRDKFEVFVLNLSNVQDDIADWIKSKANHYLYIPQELQSARHMIANLELDILFYPDAGLEPIAYFLAYSRLAPVQCLTWGHGASSGISTLDYFLSSQAMESENPQAFYSEQLVTMENLIPYYYYPEWPRNTRDKAYFGLPEDKHLYICPHSLFKIHPDFDSVLQKVLKGDPNSILVLIEGKYPNWKHKLLRRFQQSMPDEVHQVQFVPRQSSEDFVSLISLCDVMFDTPYAGGGNTTYDSIFMGTPIITWPSPFAHGRVTYACYKKMGVLDCVAKNLDDYAEIAIHIGTDKKYQDSLRHIIRKQSQVLYEDISAVRELEEIMLNWISH